MKTTNHVHRFKRHRYKTGRLIYFCLNDCNFRIDCEFALGKLSECNRCRKPFEMNSYSITLDKPHCEECHRHKGDKLSDSTKRRRKTDKPSEPLTTVSESLGEELVSDLKSRMSNLLTAKDSEPASESEPKLYIDEGAKEVVEEIKNLQYKEFKLEDEEEFL